ncbi:metal ABC transporter solute-binding protein, Zn/Mn family [Sedimenticola selenatireducens]|uniref:High-affinity zinc uptake system protein ZnuA n=1 Tax=Sedimenticola selenatireducens TaxID=191960 RepID=A0A2N6CZL9_9GAMM|nr:zinc ABC transporter substrate-binding protein [Sedimenticola selenatireducens]PLX62839.1 MAG: ABC transporter substrate-binding protein [Sedimenticola selenatireducens]
MHLIIRTLLISLLLAFGTVVSAEPLSVYVTILPQKFFVQRLGGEHVRVSVLVGPGQSPETFEPLPRQMAVLSRAALFYRIGVPFEDAWMDTVKSANPRIALLDARRGLTLREMEPAGGHRHDNDHRHTHEQGDPHIWLDPANVRVMIGHLRDQLIALDPPHASAYRENHARFHQELLELEQEIRTLLSPLKGRRFMVFHPSWGYFADAFGLQQMPIESEGKEVGARTLKQLIEQARAEQIRVIFVQRQFSQSQASALAAETGARLVSLDPLAESYIENMRQVARAISEAYQ